MEQNKKQSEQNKIKIQCQNVDTVLEKKQDKEYSKPQIKYAQKIFPIAKIKFSYKINDVQIIKDQPIIKKQQKSESSQIHQVKKKNILVLCTGNSCRSQIMQAYLQKFLQSKAQVMSAGVQIHGVNPKTIKTLAQDGIDISHNTSKHVNQYLNIPFDYIITVCDNAKQTCPYFPSNALRIHHSFQDPAKVKGSQQQVMNSFKRVRQQICVFCKQFCQKQFNVKRQCKQGVCEVILNDKNQIRTVQTQQQQPKIQKQRGQNSESLIQKSKSLILQNQSHLQSLSLKKDEEHRQSKNYQKENIIKNQSSQHQKGSLSLQLQNYHIQTPKSKVSFSYKNPQTQSKFIQNLLSSEKRQPKHNQNQYKPEQPTFKNSYSKKQQNLATNIINLTIQPNRPLVQNEKIIQNEKNESPVTFNQINIQAIPLAIRKAWKNKQLLSK